MTKRTEVASRKKNSDIRYEIISGNYDKKFGIDELTGKIFVIEPLGLYTGIDYGDSSNSDYVDVDIRTSRLHSSGIYFHTPTRVYIYIYIY